MTGQTIRRLILGAITLFVVALLGTSLLGSLGEPQITDRLELYQTDLLLHATELDKTGLDNASDEQASTYKALLGNDPLGESLKQYQKVRQSAATNLKKFETQLQKFIPESDPVVPSTSLPSRSKRITEPQQQVKKAIQQQRDLINQLDLRLGILQAEQDKTSEALKTWTELVNRLGDRPEVQPLSATAKALSGIWSNSPRLLPDAEPLMQKNLEGWFRYKSLSRLYELQQRSDALTTLKTAEQKVAQQTLIKLALVGTLPAIGGVAGLILLSIMGIRAFRNRAAMPENLTWEVLWNWETILQVLIVGFFFVGQILLPFVIAIVRAFGISFAAFGIRAQAASTLTYYLLLAGSGLAVLYLSIKPFFPLPEGWFRPTGKRSWIIWGIGGYFAALPLMLVISIFNQQIWQGQGGSNPLLQIVLEEGDPVALSLFFFTAAIAAPVFEEIFFRGFLLPSLTRYMPVGGAIGLSALIFATAHLSLSEILPLTVLGSVLGFVYTRSRGLLAPMLLHSLWNTVTMLGLFLLGSGVK